MIDFASLVLGPAMSVFGQPVTVTPLTSQPGGAAYAARGVYSLKPVEEAIEGSDIFHRIHQAELGIRLADFAITPRQGDQVTMAQGTFEIFDVILDGQGGATFPIRQIS